MMPMKLRTWGEEINGRNQRGEVKGIRLVSMDEMTDKCRRD